MKDSDVLPRETFGLYLDLLLYEVKRVGHLPLIAVPSTLSRRTCLWKR